MGLLRQYLSLLISIWFLKFVYAYNIRNHPCCQEPPDNITLAMIIDAYEIYGHDPTDKLDHLAHYQIQMMKIKRAPDQYIINEHVHIATDHLGRFITMHIKELKIMDWRSELKVYKMLRSYLCPKQLRHHQGFAQIVLENAFTKLRHQDRNSHVLLIALDDVIDNMLTMYDNHDAIKTERIATYNSGAGGAVPTEFYLSQEFYCGKNVYLFVSELYSDIYQMGRGVAPYCKGRGFHFLGFVHFMDENKYYLEEDPNVVFSTDNYIHGLECHLGICIFRFPFKKSLQHIRDVTSLPKAIVKCGTVVYKLPPLTAASCIITSGSFILDFNIQGIRFRHFDYMLYLPNGHSYYTKEIYTPLVCDHHVCEWNYTNFYGGPFIVPGDPGGGQPPFPPFIERTTEPYSSYSTEPPDRPDFGNITYSLDGCWFMFPPNYGSIAGISYLDPLSVNEYRYTCSGNGMNKGLYWYPQWMGAPPHHPYPQSGDSPASFQASVPGAYYPHLQGKAPPEIHPSLLHPNAQ